MLKPISLCLLTPAFVALANLLGACTSSPHAGTLAPTYHAGNVADTDASTELPDAGTADAQSPELDGNFVDIDAAQFLCDPSAKWSAGQPIPGLPAGANATALSVTPDELSAAWVDGAGAHVADRASATDPFGPNQAVPVADDAAPLGLSLSIDGQRLALVKPDAHGFVEATRGSRGGVFAPPTETPFALVNQWVLSLGATVADPVYGSDGTTFLYSQFGAPVTLNESRATQAGASAPWSVGTPRGGPSVLPVALDAQTLYRHPVSLSMDGLTLFISDDYPKAQTARAVYRTSLGGEFVLSVALGAKASVHVNLSCTRLYYIENGNLMVSDRT